MPSNLSLASPPLRNRQQSQQNIQNSHHAHHQHQQQQQQQQSQNQEQNQQHDCHICNANLIDSLNNIHRDITLLRRLGDHLAEKQIKELSREVWNYLFTVIDRYIFVVAICVAVITPLYLFIILPPKLDLSVTPSFVPHSH